MSERLIPYPEVRIRNGWLLAETISPHLPEYSTQKNRDANPMPTDDEVNRVINAYRDAWGPREDTIMSGMCRILDLSFRKNIVDVHIAPGFPAISEPLIMGMSYEPDHFVDALTHEMTHGLLVDNTTYENDTDSILAHWKNLFGVKHVHNTLIHIPVHAALAAVHQDVLDEPYRLERDVSICKSQHGYRQAWDYVRKLGYETIVSQLAVSHHILAENQRPLETPPPGTPSA